MHIQMNEFIVMVYGGYQHDVVPKEAWSLEDYLIIGKTELGKRLF